MSEKFDFVELEQKVTEFLRKSALAFRNLFKSLFAALQNYIRARTRFIPHVLPKNRAEIIESILDQTHVQDQLQDFARDCGMALDHVEKTFRASLYEIASDLNYLSMPFWDFLLTWVFETVYEGIDVDIASFENLRAHVSERPVIFVPNHRSHMDYLILSYVLHHQAMPAPYICAGANLSFWPLGSAFRKSGAFFIRRSYEGNRLYAMSVQAYVEALIREKSFLEFFIEGTRSRTGKLLPPRMGILSAVAHAYANGAAEDIIVVPTSFTYESVLEDKSYAQEQAGGYKKDENFWDLLRLRKYLKRRKGKVYVRLGEPLSFKDYFQGVDKAGLREKIEQFAYEITYGINKEAVVTPASLTANALLTHTSRGISESEVQSKVEAYVAYLASKGCRLSEPLQKYRPVAVRDSLRTYVRTGLLEEFRDLNEAVYRVVEGKRAFMDYYKNTSVHFFVSIGVLSCLLQKAPEDSLSLNKIHEDFSFFQTLFRKEFTFSRRQPLPAHVSRLIDYLVHAGAVKRDGEVLHFKKDHPLLETLAAPIRSFLEGYYVVWKTLSEIGPRRWGKKELVELVLDRARVLYIKEEIQNPEAANKFTVQNALSAFKSAGMVSEDTESWGKKSLASYQVTKVDEALGLRLKELITD